MEAAAERNKLTLRLFFLGCSAFGSVLGSGFGSVFGCGLDGETLEDAASGAVGLVAGIA